MKLPTTLSYDALGTRFSLEIHDKLTQETRDIIAVDTKQLLNEFEKRYSRFLFNSLVSTLNRERTITYPNQEFILLLEYGRTLATKTSGLFNMLVGSTLESRGYDSTYSFIPKATDETVFPNPLTDITISPTAITLHNGNLDLGGYGKGYVIDLLVTYLQEIYGLQYFLINGGGDMYATSNHGQPFTIYLEHPLEAGFYLGTTEILNQGFAASSPHKRSWVHNGSTYNHIIDTRPQLDSAQLCDASFIIARTCAEADAFATIALLVESEKLIDSAVTHELAYATFTAPSTLTVNRAFVVQNL